MCRQRRLIHWLYLIGCFRQISLNLLSSPPICCHAFSFVFICTWKSYLIEPLIVALDALSCFLLDFFLYFFWSANQLTCLSTFHTSHVFTCMAVLPLTAFPVNRCHFQCTELWIGNLALWPLSLCSWSWYCLLWCNLLGSIMLCATLNQCTHVPLDHLPFVRTITISMGSWPVLASAGISSFFVLHHFLSRPQRCLPETMLSSFLAAHSAVTDWCTAVNR